MGTIIFSILDVLLVVAVAVLVYLLLQTKKELNDYKEEYKDVIDIDLAVAEKNKTFDEIVADIKTIKSEYKEKHAVYNLLLGELAIIEEKLETASYGLYSPHFGFDTSEDYKQAITETRNAQKEMIKSGEAIVCDRVWEVGGSKAEGKKMMTRQKKLMMRAFNNECDSAIGKARWNNISMLEKRVDKAFEAINKLGEVQQIEISEDYLSLKQDELHLAFENEEKKQEEKEEQRRIKEEMREEEKARREIEAQIQKSEKEERQYQQALEKARDEVKSAQGEKATRLEEQIRRLQEKLDEAESNKERAKSQAQLTKSGHVYVISNIGSFGKNVYKIGMTRRLEPLDRVKELGDASVPFPFDVHAIIYTEDAPAMENQLHRAFNENRMNLVNNRKEFFNVPISHIEKEVKQLHGEFKFTILAEAKEYRETVSIMSDMETMVRPDDIEIPLPEMI